MQIAFPSEKEAQKKTGIFPSKYKWPSSWMQQQHLQFLTPALWQKQSSPGLLISTSEVLAKFLRNTETGSPVHLILVATSHIVSASRAGCDILLSGPLPLSSAKDGRAVPELKGASSSILPQAENSAPEPALSLLQGSGLYTMPVWPCSSSAGDGWHSVPSAFPTCPFQNQQGHFGHLCSGRYVTRER